MHLNSHFNIMSNISSALSTYPVTFHSRPKADADWTCPRSRYYAYDFADGIVKDNLALELFIGTCVHDGTAAIANAHVNGTVDINQISTTIRENVYTTLIDHAEKEVNSESPEVLQANEQATLVESLLRAFCANGWKSLLTEYPEIVAIEKECIFPHGFDGLASKKGPFVFQAKPDLLLRGPDGLVYIEYKTSGTKKLEWIESWNTAIQVHATMKAVEFTLNEPCQMAIVQGFYKGSTQYGKYSSQMVYAYEKKGNPPFTQNIVSHEYKYGYKRTPVWELDGGSAEWVKKLPKEVLSEQLPQTPLIFLNEDMATTFFRQRAIREQDVRVGLSEPISEETLDRLFPQSFSECRPAWGSECNFRRICHGPAKHDPLSHGYLLKDHSHSEGFIEVARELGVLE